MEVVRVLVEVGALLVGRLSGVRIGHRGIAFANCLQGAYWREPGKNNPR